MRQQRPQFLLHARELGGGGVHGGNQLRVAGGQCGQGGVVQAGGEAGAPGGMFIRGACQCVASSST